MCVTKKKKKEVKEIAGLFQLLIKSIALKKKIKKIQDFNASIKLNTLKAK